MTARVRVLVVDDSAFARKVLRESLGAHPSIEVVGYARDGLDALEQIEALRPDVVTLDLEMPQLDGVGVLRALAGRDAPRVVLTTAASDEARVAEALAAGAVDAVRKPTAVARVELYEMRDEVVAKVLAAAGARPSVVDAPPASAPGGRAGVVVVGASTGASGDRAASRRCRGRCRGRWWWCCTSRRAHGGLRGAARRGERGDGGRGERGGSRCDRGSRWWRRRASTCASRARATGRR
ncbi:MAG: response regulator [Polyangiales bacterium]